MSIYRLLGISFSNTSFLPTPNFHFYAVNIEVASFNFKNILLELYFDSKVLGNALIYTISSCKIETTSSSIYSMVPIIYLSNQVLNWSNEIFSYRSEKFHILSAAFPLKLSRRSPSHPGYTLLCFQAACCFSISLILLPMLLNL